MNTTTTETNAGASSKKTKSSDTVTVKKFTDLDPEMVAAWREIYEADKGAYVRQHPDWVHPEIDETEIAGGGATLLPEWGSGGKLAALGVIIPKRIVTRRFTGPGLSFRLNGVRLAGNRFLQAEKDAAMLDRLFDRALDHVNKTGADFLMIEDLDRRDPLCALADKAKEKGFQVFAPTGWQPRLRIELPEKAETYWGKFSGKTRSTFRRKLKKFGTTRLEKITKPEEVERFLAQAHEISKQTWQTRQLGLRVANGPMERAQLSSAGKEGLLRSYLWFVNDEPVAFLIGNQTHGVFNYEEVGYATAHAKNSPGQMMLLQVLDELFTENPPKIFDFGGGDADYKRLFSNDQSESGTIWIVPPTTRLKSIMAYMKAYISVKTRVRHWAATSPYATKLRQRVRYGGAKVEAKKQDDDDKEDDQKSDKPAATQAKQPQQQKQQQQKPKQPNQNQQQNQQKKKEKKPRPDQPAKDGDPKPAEPTPPPTEEKKSE